MKNYNSIFLLIFIQICSCFAIIGNAQNIDTDVYGQIIVKVDSTAEVGETKKIEFIYSSKDPSDTIVSPTWKWDKRNKGFEVIYGPKISKQQSYTIDNWHSRTSYSQVFSFYLLFNDEGEYSLPIMKAINNFGKVIQSKPLKIFVRQKYKSRLFSEESNDKSADLKKELIVIEATVNKNHIDLGDSVDVELRLIHNVPIIQSTSAIPLKIGPAYWKEKELSKEIPYERVEYKGDTVNSVVFSKVTIIPIQPGKIELEPMKYIVTYLQDNPDVDPFEAFFNGENSYRDRDTVLTANPITIKVDNKHLISKIEDIKACFPKHDKGIVIDRSSSLFAKPDSVSTSFFQLENQFLQKFFKDEPFSNYSLTLFAGKPHFPNPSELSNIENIIPSKDNDGSSIYNALLASALHEGALTTERSSYSILLLTDGNDNASILSEKTLINILLSHGIRVDVVAFSTKNDSVFYNYKDSMDSIDKDIKIINRNDFSDVERIAKATNGLFFLIENESQISEAIHKVKEHILKAGSPKRQLDKGFKPNKVLLYRLYKEIMSDVKTSL